MTHYYRVDAAPDSHSGFIEADGDHGLMAFMVFAGQFIDPGTVPVPCRFRVTIDPDLVAELDDYYPNIPLMSRRMLDALRSAGADNLQVFAAEVMLPDGGVCNDFAVVNIVGTVACANMPASDSAPLAEGSYFFRLAIDPQRTGGHPIFRLAESLVDVVVAEPVAQALRQAALRHLVLDSVTPSP